mmetsp:Transcript_70440/g.229023  ORF Transcript_70440/g.229023 Transcript_70440/m.229023 type:complete len:454 (+) Transcript_70440:120-1481(+)
MAQKSASTPASALVVGGGIGGLSAALALHKAGLKVEVFEQAPRPAEVGAGINVLPGAVQVLHDLGLEEALKSTGPNGGAGVQTSELVYCASSGTVILREMRGLQAGNSAPQYSIHRGWLHMMLLATVRERLGEEHVHCGHSFRRLEQSAEGVVAHFAVPKGEDECKPPWNFTGEASFSGDILIGSDGLKSKVRAQLFPGERAEYTGWRIYRGCLEIDSQFYDGKSMLTYGTGTAASVLYPVCERRRQEGKTLLNWGINCQDSILASHLQGEPGEESWARHVSKDEFLHIVDGWKFPEGCFPDPAVDFTKLIKDTPDGGITCYALFDRDPTPTWTVDRVTLLGDAAHPLLPFGSQGAGQALLDVAALYEAMVGCGDDYQAGLKAYEAVRAEAAGKVVLTNRSMGPTKLLKMFEDAVGSKTPDEQAKWVHEHEKELADFSNNYRQNVSVETGAAS